MSGASGKSKLRPELIAPCGMNCGGCKRYLAYSNGMPEERGRLTHCQGCLESKRICYVKRDCKDVRKNLVRLCFECKQFPCENIRHLDERYRKNYSASVIGNLEEIKRDGMESFLAAQGERF